MGHFWGGSIITGFAARYPDRVEGLAFVDSGQMDYQDSPNFPHGKSLDDLIADARESRIRAPKEDFEQAAQEGLRRPVTPELLEAVRAGLREEDGEPVGIVTPEVRGAVLHGITKMRVTENWPAIARPAFRSCCSSPPSPRRPGRSTSGRCPRSESVSRTPRST